MCTGVDNLWMTLSGMLNLRNRHVFWLRVNDIGCAPNVNSR
jgi:hypothetical protein